MESYKGYKKTNLRTYTSRGCRNIYINEEGKLFYRQSNTWHLTYKNYCIDENGKSL